MSTYFHIQIDGAVLTDIKSEFAHEKIIDEPSQQDSPKQYEQPIQNNRQSQIQGHTFTVRTQVANRVGFIIFVGFFSSGNFQLSCGKNKNHMIAKSFLHIFYKYRNNNIFFHGKYSRYVLNLVSPCKEFIFR